MKWNFGKKISGLQIRFQIIELMLKGSYTVYGDVLKSRQVRRTFKLMNPKHKDWASVHDESLILNLLVAGLKYVNSVPVYF